MPVPRLAESLLEYLGTDEGLTSRAAELGRQGVAAALLLDMPSLGREQRDALRDASEGAIARTLMAQRLAVTAGAALDEAGVSHVFLKGEHLARLWDCGWSRQAARTWGDVDVVVHRDDVDKAVAALSAVGGERGPASARQLTVAFAHGLAVDLHWELLNEPALLSRYRLDFDAISKTHVIWDGASGRMDPTMTAVHTCLHALLSDLSRAAAIVDVDAAFRNPDLDWDHLSRFSRLHDLELPLAVSSGMATLWMATPVPDAVARPTRSLWLTACRVVAARDPARHLRSGWSGGEVLRHTRHNSAASLRSLLGTIPEQVRVQRRLHKHG